MGMIAGGNVSCCGQKFCDQCAKGGKEVFSGEEVRVRALYSTWSAAPRIWGSALLRAQGS